MRFDAMYPSNYMKASDFEDGPRTLQISSIEMERMGDGEQKPVLYFSNGTKGLVLNKTNGNVLAQLYGNDTDNWEDKPIQLFATETEFQGKRTPCIRLREPPQKKGAGRKGKEVAPPQPQQQEQSFDDFGDEIPF